MKKRLTAISLAIILVMSVVQITFANDNVLDMSALIADTSAWQFTGTASNDGKKIGLSGASETAGYAKTLQFETLEFKSTLVVPWGNWGRINFRQDNAMSVPWALQNTYSFEMQYSGITLYKWLNGSYEALGSTTYNIIGDDAAGTEHAVKITVKNNSDGSVNIVMAVDDEEVINATDSKNPITSHGQLSFQIGGNGKFDISGVQAGDEDNATDMSALIADASAWQFTGTASNDGKKVGLSGAFETAGYTKTAEFETLKFKSTLVVPWGNWGRINFRQDNAMSVPWALQNTYSFEMQYSGITLYKWLNGSYEALGSSAYNIIGDDEAGTEHDVKITVKNNSDGSVNIVMAVDGTEIINATDSKNPITSHGQLSFQIGADGRFDISGIKPAGVDPGDEDNATDISALIANTSAWNFTGTASNDGEKIGLSGAFETAGYTKTAEFETLKFKSTLVVPWGNWGRINFRQDNATSAPWALQNTYSFEMQYSGITLYKWLNGSYESLGSSAYNIIGDDAAGTEHDVKITAKNNSDGSVSILMSVDGSVIINATDSKNPITSHGQLSFQIGGNGKFNISGYDKVPEIVIPDVEIPEGALDFTDIICDVDNWKNTGNGGKNDGVTVTMNVGDQPCGYIGGKSGGIYAFKFNAKTSAGKYSALTLRSSGYANPLWNLSEGYSLMFQQNSISLLAHHVNGTNPVASYDTGAANDGRTHTIIVYLPKSDTDVSDTEPNVKVSLDGEEILTYSDKSPKTGSKRINIHSIDSYLQISGIRTPKPEDYKDITPLTEPLLAHGIGKDGKIDLTWRYNPTDFAKIKGVNIYDENGDLIDFVEYPARHYLIDNLDNAKTYNYTVKTLHNVGGIESVGAHISCTPVFVPDPEYKPLPKIKVEPGEKTARFVKETGEEYTPNGFNWIRLVGDHASFHPDYYDHDEAVYVCKLMKEWGSNVVRIFISGRFPEMLGVAGSADTNGLDEAYMNNVVDFIKTAASYGIYVMPTLCGIPLNDYFDDMVGGDVVENGVAKIEGNNKHLLTTNGINAKKEYIRLFLDFITKKDPTLLSAFFSLQLENEYLYLTAGAPMTLTEGTVTVANGKTYDMSDTEQVDAMKAESYIYWANELVDYVKSINPDILVSASYLYDTYPWGYAGIGEKGMVINTQTKVDFHDVHWYIGPNDYASIESSITKEFARFGWNEIQEDLKKRPWIVGEWGVNGGQHKGKDFNYVAQSMGDLREILYKLGFRGFVFWTFDTIEQVDGTMQGCDYDFKMSKYVAGFDKNELLANVKTRYYNAENTEALVLTDESAVKAVVSAKDGYRSDDSLTVILSAYDKDGRLVNTTYKAGVLAEGTDISTELIDVSGADYVKTFIWKNGSLEPAAPAKKIFK